LNIKHKIATLRAVSHLLQGRLLAHPSSTVAGIAAHPKHPQGIQRLRRFKQRQGPFLLLANSKKTIFKQCRYITQPLRRMLRTYIHQSVTLIIPCTHRRARKKGAWLFAGITIRKLVGLPNIVAVSSYPAVSTDEGSSF